MTNFAKKDKQILNMELDLLAADIVLHYLKTTYTLNKQIDFDHDTGSHVYRNLFYKLY